MTKFAFMIVWFLKWTFLGRTPTLELYWVTYQSSVLGYTLEILSDDLHGSSPELCIFNDVEGVFIH